MAPRRERQAHRSAEAVWWIVVAAALAGCGSPQSFFAFDDKVAWYEWQKTMADWRARTTVAAGHAQGTVGGNNDSFAQSFVPHCARIKAVELCTYPVGGAGWIRLEICRDDHGLPARRALARCWVRLEKNSGGIIPHGEFIAFDMPDINVRPEGAYWLTYAEYCDPQTPGCSITNLGSSRDSGYSEGKLIRRFMKESSEIEDAKFRILSQCPPVPLMHRATSEERRTLPSRSCANAHWAQAPGKWHNLLQTSRKGGNRAMP